MTMTRKKHDSNICFGCRLHALIKELYPNGPQNSKQLAEIMIALAGCSADMLQCTDMDGVKHFLSVIAAKVMENEHNHPTFH